MDNLTLERWRALPASEVLALIADHAKPDPTYRERSAIGTTRWHASVAGRDFELLCSGPKFFDTRSCRGGGGAVDLAMHLLEKSFKDATKHLREVGI